MDAYVACFNGEDQFFHAVALLPNSLSPPRIGMRRRHALAGAAGLWIFTLHARGAEPVAVAADPLVAAEMKRAAERGNLCSPANVSGTGLRGEYFAHGLHEEKPLLVRIDPTIDFDGSLEWPRTLASERPAAAHWIGWVRPPLSGIYRFHLAQPDARVTIGHQPVVAAGLPSATGIELGAGRYYPIEVDVPRLGATGGRLQLEWTAPYGARYVIPRALLFVPTGSAP